MVLKADGRILSVLVIASAIFNLLEFIQAVSNHPLLLLVIFDGFRWDYMERFDLPNFKALAADGVQAGRVINVMPTLTMSSHYTMITGMYPETHGVVFNDFLDPEHGHYSLYESTQQTESKWFDNGAEPIWVTNQKTHYKRFSGALAWPTALAPVMGVSPTYHKGPLFNLTLKNETRIDNVIQWFLHPENPINLGLLYFDEPDLIGHQFGPDSVQLRETVVELDKLLGYLIRQLKINDLLEPMNIILTADHGMADVPQPQYINISEFLSRELYEDYGLSSVGFIYPKPGKEEDVYVGLKKAQQKYPQLQVHTKESVLLKALNYTRNDRISPIVLIAEEGWYIVNREEQLLNPERGLHGYPPTVSSMQPFFVAHGPAFKQKYYTDSVRSIDFYELMCHLLQITPAPNNGTLGYIKHILLPDTTSETNTSFGWGMAVVVTPFITLLLGIYHWKPKKSKLTS